MYRGAQEHLPWYEKQKVLRWRGFILSFGEPTGTESVGHICYSAMAVLEQGMKGTVRRKCSTCYDDDVKPSLMCDLPCQLCDYVLST